MTQKVVRTAVVEPINISQLQKGDFILWGRYKILIESIDHQNKIVIAEHPIDILPHVSAYYRITSCIEERPDTTCPGCRETIKSYSDAFDEFCTPRCKDQYDEFIKTAEY